MDHNKWTDCGAHIHREHASFNAATKERNSGKSMVPLPSVSNLFKNSVISPSVGLRPVESLTAVPNSLVLIVPSPSLSKTENCSLHFAIISSERYDHIFGKIFSHFMIRLVCWW